MGKTKPRLSVWQKSSPGMECVCDKGPVTLGGCHGLLEAPRVVLRVGPSSRA